MSYQVLARKYRPRSFDTLVGQEHVVRALTHALDQKRLHHAWLFTGTRGVGKTTLSRILAKALNCQGADGNGDVTAQPCGVCDACTAIDAGRFVDYIEMDAASNRGVDEMAQLLEQAVYAPSNARYKIYMIDEVHMLSSHAFNSMLKTLEEPPEHVKFILATTDPQKIPVTVLSRCLQFNLKQMPPGHIVDHLQDILGQEGIACETPALRLLAQGAQGSMRDALSLTDQAIAYSAGKVTLEAVQGMLGALDHTYLVRVLDALLAGNGADMLAIADEMAGRSLSWNEALKDLGSLLHRIALAQSVPAALPNDLPEREDILRLAGLMAADEVQLYYQIVVHGRNELGLAPDEYAGFTMTLLRMLAFRPDDGGGALAAPEPAVRAARAVGTAAPVAAPATAMPAAQAAPPAPTSVAAQAAPAAPAARAVPTGPTAPAAPTAARGAPAAPAHPRSSAYGATQDAPRAASGPARAALEAARGGMRTAAMPRASAAPTPPAAPSAPAAAARMPQPLTATRDEVPPWMDDIPDADGGSAVLERVARPSPAYAPPAEELQEMSGQVLREEPAQYIRSDRRQEARAEAAGAASAAAEKPAQETVAAVVREPVAIPGWPGYWPELAASLPLRGVVQQLALQSELVQCQAGEGGLIFKLMIPVDTLRSAGSPDKLANALSEQLGKRVQIETQLGAVSFTASAAATAQREERQRAAEQTIQEDPFVQALRREFNATVVPGSVRPN